MKTAIEHVRGRVSGLVPLFAAAVLTACGGGGSDSPADAPVPAPAPAAVAPAITTDVSALSVGIGADASFTVTATGTGPTYQWQSSVDGVAWVDIAGATTDTLLLKAVAFADNRKFVRVIVSNSTGSVTSSPVQLTVNPGDGAPVVGNQPLAASVVAPAVATFSVVATGTPTPTYQWQRSNDAGVTYANVGTGASYTTAATAVTDNGALFRVVVSNAAGAVTSTPVPLNVATVVSAPLVVTQPQAVNVTAPGTATFAVGATGAPTPTYQWQVSRDAGVSFTSVVGATAASYTTAATSTADNGLRLRVVVTNSAGTVTSGAATLGVAAAVSVSKLAGRAWTVGQSLESGDTSVTSHSTGIDDAGNAISVFVKSDGTRAVLYATRGVPGAAGSSAVWSAPVAIDTAAAPAGGTNASNARVLAVAPNGNAAVSWVASAPCTSGTYSTTVTSSCNYVYTARYTASNNTWATPVQMADTPDATPVLVQRLNSNGDLALLYPGWERSGTSSYTARPAVLWQPASQTAVQKRVINDTTLKNYDMQMDKAGNMVLAGDATQNSTTDIVAYRGTMAAGFGAQEVLDVRTAVATYQDLAVGLNGQVIVVWHQNNGTVDTRMTADLTTPTGAWRLTEMEPYANTGNFTTNGLLVDDAGQGLYAEYSNGSCTSYFHRFAAGAWSALQRFPAEFPDCNVSSVSRNRNGDLLIFEGSRWSTYDAATNSMIRTNATGATSVYGTSGGSLGTSSKTSAKALSISGIGVLTTAVAYDTLPTPATPAGDGRSAVLNLWGLLLK